jgi:hypothetical protein
LTRAYCLHCNDQVDVDDDGLCPQGHTVSTEDLGPQPWIGRALSSLDKQPAAPPRPGPATNAAGDEPDELAALLADLDDGGPSDLVTEDAAFADPADLAIEDVEAPQSGDTSSELAALAEDLAMRAGGDDLDEDDDLGAIDDAMTAWDEQEDAIVAPSARVPLDDDVLADDALMAALAAEDFAADEAPDTTAIPPPPPPGTAVAAPSPPPPPPTPESEPEPMARPEPMGAPSVWADEEAPDAPAAFAASGEPPVSQVEPRDEPRDEPPAPPEPSPDPSSEPREIDLTNFTASGKRVDTSAAPRKRGRFGLGR